MTVALSTTQTTTELPGGRGLPPAAEELALLRAENAELRTLLAIQRDLSHGSTPKEVLQEVVGQVHAAVGCDRSYALLREGSSRRIEPAATVGLSNATVQALKDVFPSPTPIPAIERALSADRPLLIEDARANSLIPPAIASTLGLGALLLVPIRGLAQESIGILLLDFDRPINGISPLTPDRVRLAGAVAGQLTLLLENALLYEQLRRRTVRLEALNEIGLTLAAGSSGEPAALFNRLQPQVADVVQGLCCLAVLNEGSAGQRGTLTIWCASEGTTVETHEAVPLGDDALSTAIRGGRRLHCPTPEAFNGAALPIPHGTQLPGGSVPQSAIYLPLRLRRRTFGALALISPHPHAYTAEQIEFLTTVAAQTAVTLEHGRLYGVLRARGDLRRRLLEQTLQAQEAERKALVDGVLDGALQELASCNYRLDLCIRLSELGRHDRCRDESGQTRLQLAERIEGLRAMVGGLRPTNLDLLGLQSVLRDELTAFQQQTGIQATFQGRYKERLDSATETRAYRIVQELLSNVRRHAGAKTVAVELRSISDEVLLSVTDDGVGFEADAVLNRDDGIGLHAVRESAEILGGAIHVQSRPGMGTRIEVLLPRLARERGNTDR